MSFPHTAVLFLRSTLTMPDKMRVAIRTPGGEVSYDVPAMKVKSYTIEDIFEKGLLFLIPFYIFTYETGFEQINNNESKLAELKAEYESIHDRLDRLSENGAINEFYKKTIMDMSERVLANIAAKYKNIQKGVGPIMCGQVLDYEAKRILNTGREEGRAEGREEGRTEGIFDTLVKMVRKERLTLDEAAEEADMTPVEFAEKAGLELA